VIDKTATQPRTRTYAVTYRLPGSDKVRSTRVLIIDGYTVPEDAARILAVVHGLGRDAAAQVEVLTQDLVDDTQG
jgi:hypothetical protein